jgi:hypothetical protein
MATVSERPQIFGDEYWELLDTLNEGSVHVHFDPYEDIAWDSPELQTSPTDAGWILSPELDPLGATEWYQNLPREQQIELGRWRMVNAIRVGGCFESLLIRGLMHYAISLPNKSPEFRYCLHEMTEECNHIQMFQEVVNRCEPGVPGMRTLFRLTMPIIGFVGGYTPMIFMIGILGGEEPIDHYQKALVRSGHKLPPMVERAIEIHVQEEARHISFAAEFLRVHSRQANRFTNALCAVTFPLIMRWLGGEIMTSPKAIKRRFNVPDDVWREAFWGDRRSKQIMASYFNDMRALTDEIGWRNRWTKPIWRWCGIDGEPSRFRGEPERGAITQ